MTYLRSYSIFISHAWRYDDDYTRMVNLLDRAPRFLYRNYSVPRHDPAIANSTVALQQALDAQMRPA
jgi:hypothetical protein